MDVQGVLDKLLSFRNEVVEPAIGHVASGAGNLNEVQVEKAKEQIQAIADQALTLKDEALALLAEGEQVVSTAEVIGETVKDDVQEDETKPAPVETIAPEHETEA